MASMPAKPQCAAKQQWKDLNGLTTAQLRQKWLDLFGGEFAPRLKRELLIGALAYQLQAQACGGLKARTRQKLGEVAADPHAPLEPGRALVPGTRLLREWRGITHVVEISDQGFIWQGRKLSSLSAIAREITGTRWSGPRFFGLNNAKAGAAS